MNQSIFFIQTFKRAIGVCFFSAASFIAHNLLVADGWDPGLDIDQDVTFVSLGSHCEIAILLNENNLRKAAFPFDWLLTCNHDRFLLILENDFAFFLDKQQFMQHPLFPYVIENCYYKTEFLHDWPFSDAWTNPARYSQQLQDMHTKYVRRINRFRALGHYSGKVFFIRIAYDIQSGHALYWGTDGVEQITAQEAQELEEALARYFPHLDFTLVIINYIENNAPHIHSINNVKEFKVSKYNKHAGYTVAFHALLNSCR